MRIPVFGASVERGYWDFRGGWVHRLQEDLDRYRWEEDEDYSIYNLGISGDTSRDILERIEAEIEARDNSEEMGIILRITGTNDSQIDVETGENLIEPGEYEDNLREIIGICREYTDKIFLVGGVPIVEEDVDPMPWKPTHAYREAEIAKYSKKLRQVSKEKDVPLIDLESEIETEEWKGNCMRDGVHPNREGHRIMYEIVKRKLAERGFLPEEI